MVTIDFETKSYADLKKVGAWAYSEDPTTDVICACWGIDDGPIQEWWPVSPTLAKPPSDLMCAMVQGHTIEAHNVAFERSIWENVLAPRYGWDLPHHSKWRDLMAVACYLALPARVTVHGHALVVAASHRQPLVGLKSVPRSHLLAADHFINLRWRLDCLWHKSLTPKFLTQ